MFDSINNGIYLTNSSNPTTYTPIYLIRLSNNIFSTIIGLNLSILLFYLIIKQSPEHFRSYRKILMLSACVDTYLLLQSFLLQMRMITSNSITMITFTGPFGIFFGQRAFCIFLFLQNTGPQIGVAILPIQYFYRFYTLTRHHPPKLAHALFCFCLVASISLIPLYNIVNWYCLMDFEPIDYSYLWPKDETVPQMLARPANQGNFLKQFSGSLTLIVYYLVALWFAYLTMKELNGRFSSISYNESVKSVQIQLGRTLFIQSLIPLLIIICPRFAFMAATFFGFSTKYDGDIVSLIVVWFPVMSQTSTIIFIVPYRRFCLRFLPCSRFYKKGTNSTIPFKNSLQTLAQPTHSDYPVRIN